MWELGHWALGLAQGLGSMGNKIAELSNAEPSRGSKGSLSFAAEPHKPLTETSGCGFQDVSRELWMMHVNEP